MNALQHEITQDEDLLDAHGELRQVGWSRGARLRYEPASIRAARQRIKEWEHYTVLSPDVSLNLTLVHLGVFGAAHVEALRLADGKMDSRMDLFVADKKGLPHTPYVTGTFEKRTKHVRFEVGERQRSVRFAFDSGSPLRGELRMAAPGPREGLAVVTPFDASELFFYEYKVPDVVVSGWVELRGRRHELDPAHTRAIMDWGRGAWPRRTRWLWGWGAAASAGRNVSFNLGEGFGNMSRASENAFVVDGTLHKLGRVRWIYDPTRRMEPWRFEDDEQRVSLRFDPLRHRHGRTNLLIWSARLDKVYGTYTGTLVLDDGTRVGLERARGFAEEMTQRW